MKFGDDIATVIEASKTVLVFRYVASFRKQSASKTSEWSKVVHLLMLSQVSATGECYR